MNLIAKQNLLINLLVLTILFSIPVNAQVNIGSHDEPKPFSILELTTTQNRGGLRVPQLTTQQRDDNLTPQLMSSSDRSAEGLVIFNTSIQCLEFWNGTKWISLCSNVIEQEKLVMHPPLLPNQFEDTESENKFVGAFWRSNQTGERIIRTVNMPAGTVWSVVVTYYDLSKWDGDEIVMAVGGTHDPGVTFAAGENPGNAESYQVNGSSTISGTIPAGGGPIVFRIGLKKIYAAGVSNINATPRYAVVTLNYSGGSQIYYLRQGEGADYIPGDDQRPDSKKWSPYNLGDITGKSQNDLARFASFPTQAGYFYQWGYSTTENTPKPYPPTGSVSGWSSTKYDVQYTLSYVCPSGYTVPTLGNLSYFSIRLIGIPPTPEPTNTSYSFGYYADGFFDRRRIVNGVTSIYRENSVVSSGDDIAYIGRLFYSASYASLFMPAAGYRDSGGDGNDGLLIAASVWGTICSSTPYQSYDAHRLFFGQESLYVRDFDRSGGSTVRCVAN